MKNYHGVMNQALVEGIVYSTDFKDIKYSADHAFNRAVEAFNSQYFYAGLYKIRTKEESEIRNAISMNISQFPSKKLMKLLDGAENTPCVQAVRDLVNEWQLVSQKLNTLKGMVVKGRKPSDTPRKTKERTIENTGTCAVCGRNIKLDSNGDMVAHGYRVMYGMQQGNCFGVGYPPIEVSPEGAVAYLKMLKDFLAEKESELPKAKAAVENDIKNTKLINVMCSIERDIHWVSKDIETYTDMIDNWVARPLPE